MKKGVEVAVEGKIANRTYTDQDGVKRFVSEVIVQEFVVLTRKPA
jgi:single-strand DNA-binding protein